MFMVALDTIYGIKWVKKIVGKLIKNMFLGPFIFCSIISPRPTHIYKI